MHEDLGVTVRFSRPGPRRSFNPDTRELALRDGLSEAQLVFEMALQYCLIAYRDVCDNLVSELPAGEAQELATLGLAQYVAAAVTMPDGHAYLWLGGFVQGTGGKLYSRSS